MEASVFLLRFIRHYRRDEKMNKTILFDFMVQRARDGRQKVQRNIETYIKDPDREVEVVTHMEQLLPILNGSVYSLGTSGLDLSCTQVDRIKVELKVTSYDSRGCTLREGKYQKIEYTDPNEEIRQLESSILAKAREFFKASVYLENENGEWYLAPTPKSIRLPFTSYPEIAVKDYFYDLDNTEVPRGRREVLEELREKLDQAILAKHPSPSGS